MEWTQLKLVGIISNTMVKKLETAADSSYKTIDLMLQKGTNPKFEHFEIIAVLDN